MAGVWYVLTDAHDAHSIVSNTTCCLIELYIRTIRKKKEIWNRMVVIRTYISKAFISNCYFQNVGIFPTVSKPLIDVNESMTSSVFETSTWDWLTLNAARCTFLNLSFILYKMVTLIIFFTLKALKNPFSQILAIFPVLQRWLRDFVTMIPELRRLLLVWRPLVTQSLSRPCRTGNIAKLWEKGFWRLLL